jgi:hypothetical protein
MRRRLQLSAFATWLFTGMAFSGINWKAVWLEPRTPVVLAVGETQPYTVMGLNGADVKAELTKSQYLKITSSDPGIVEVDQKNAVLIGKKLGQAEIRISFSEATSYVHAVVKERKTDSAGNGGELASVVLYYHRGNWLTWQGAD